MPVEAEEISQIGTFSSDLPSWLEKNAWTNNAAFARQGNSAVSVP